MSAFRKREFCPRVWGKGSGVPEGHVCAGPAATPGTAKDSASRQSEHRGGSGLVQNFNSFIDRVGVWDQLLKPLEYLTDRFLRFVDYAELRFYQERDVDAEACCREQSEVRRLVKRWVEFQDSQRILLTTPSVLVGYRVQVYRAEGTTQWYTAVIVSYNDSTRELTVTDDTVLEEHNEDPCLVQMRLIGDGDSVSLPSTLTFRSTRAGLGPYARTFRLPQKKQKNARKKRVDELYLKESPGIPAQHGGIVVLRWRVEGPLLLGGGTFLEKEEAFPAVEEPDDAPRRRG
ncbi:hypothetical protein HPB48_014148 [Haemaphysalis longicornis]|uniref:JmjC domain-containing histone demethylation protein 2C n=1 Tax=Haemaphysalis longicornis TaxID=44386 RepID=A0A9J6FA00_HAELO|nr:hypothetical protein HPB48_014148 [Haemaphysalis longicornis]